MSITPDILEKTFQEMGLTVHKDGEDFIHSTEGTHAPVLHSVVTLDDDGSGVTLLTALTTEVPETHRAPVCELLNLVHGQSLWNVRFHLDDAGRIFSVAKHLLWGKPFNAVQFGDIFFSSLVSADRLFPCIEAVTNKDEEPEQAFERFFGTEEAVQ